ncbi:MAG: alanine dehydrogenase [Chitinophagales bacterium]|nr:alanine dehydrogenase [Chitinophagales bacterium]
MTKIGVIREGKVPPDARAPLTPQQCAQAIKDFGLEVVVAPSPIRCYTDEEYRAAGVSLQEDLSDCDILLGVKEVPIDWLLPGKTYLFFSHTIKKQPYNKPLLQAVLQHNIRLIDYEVITDEKGQRLIAFGYYAGIVGAHNGLWTYGQRSGAFSLPRLKDCHDYAEAVEVYQQTQLPPLRIVLTGGGRVAAGAARNLLDMGIQQVSPADYLQNTYEVAVFTQIHAHDYARRKDGQAFDKAHFYAHGDAYESSFAPYYRCSDIFLNGIFYDKKAPAFFSVEAMRSPDFKIQVIADITCDIMPDASVPATIRPSKIADPVFGFDPHSGAECAPFSPAAVDIMAIDNLPSELPRDASAFFGEQMLRNVLPELIHGRQSDVIVRGMIAENGALTERYKYLSDYVQ